MTPVPLLVWVFLSFMAGGLFGAMTMAILVASKATPPAPPRTANAPVYKSTTKTVRKRNTSTSSTPRPKT
jgi:hypothetical protein